MEPLGRACVRELRLLSAQEGWRYTPRSVLHQSRDGSAHIHPLGHRQGGLEGAMVWLPRRVSTHDYGRSLMVSRLIRSLVLMAIVFAGGSALAQEMGGEAGVVPVNQSSCAQSCQKKFAKCQIASKGTKEAYCRQKLRSCANRCTARSQKRRLRSTR